MRSWLWEYRREIGLFVILLAAWVVGSAADTFMGQPLT